MEGVSASMYKGLKGYWRRKDYERLNLDGYSPDRRRKNRVELQDTNGSSSNRRRRFSWRIKITPKLRFFHNISSTKKVIKRLRDAYVKMMVSFARSRVFINGFGGGGGSGASVGYGLGKPNQYDEKVLIEIYKSLIAQGQFVPRDAGILLS
ncbi:hypothetical protein BVC80_9091g86 [Macleaya cordata]|uniref:Uncharacterized protein n=1 Tax=Macleaya cordata TaxID=56857 RepID=A0A200PWI2_MACCD|nr:hypothetical protein BVC80_9091g86 [Macleaya cordata]